LVWLQNKPKLLSRAERRLPGPINRSECTLKRPSASISTCIYSFPRVANRTNANTRLCFAVRRASLECAEKISCHCDDAYR